MRISKTILLFILLLTWKTPLYAESTTASCISSLKELSGNAKIKQIIQSMGGITKLQGKWTFEGRFLGFQKKVTVDFSCVGNEGFFQVSKDDESLGKIRICESDNPNTLKLEGSKKAVLVQRGATDNNIKLAEVSKQATGKNHGRFYSFFKNLSNRPKSDTVFDESLAYNPPLSQTIGGSR